MLDIRFPANNSYVGFSRLIVSGFARQEGISEEKIYDLKLAVSEVVSSLIQNKNKTVNLAAERKNGSLIVSFDGIKSNDAEKLFSERLVNKETLLLLVDRLTINRRDNEEVGITLYKKI